jgi:hypothetical protein
LFGFHFSVVLSGSRDFFIESRFFIKMSIKRIFVRLLAGIIFFLAASFPNRTGSGAYPAAPSRPAIQLLQSDREGVLLELFVPTYDLSASPAGEAGWRTLTIPGGDLTREPGKPALPVLATLVGVPAGTRLSLEILVDETRAVPGQHSIQPAARPSPVSEDLQAGAWVETADLAFYARDAWYPEAPARLAGEAWIRDQRVVRVEFNPFQYNPGQGELLWHRHVRVAVRFEDAASQPDGDPGQAGRSPAFEPALRETVLNYEQSMAWRQPPGQAAIHSPAGVQDLLATGPRYRIVVDEDGLYRLSYDDLRDAGMPVGLGGVDPHSFHLTNQGEDVAIWIKGESDTDFQFDPGDTLTFYGQKFRGDRLAQRHADENRHWYTYPQQSTSGNRVPWLPEFNARMAEKYTDENVYWLTAGGLPGPRMSAVDGDPTGSAAPTPPSYTATVHAERSLRWWTWHFQGEDTWFWERMQGENTWTFTTTLTALAGGTQPAGVRARVGAASFNDFASPDHRALLQVNEREEPLAEAAWDGMSSYTFEAQVAQSALREGVNELKYTALPGTAVPDSYFDWFEIDYQRLFQASSGQILFPAEAEGTWKYELSRFPSAPVEIYDVTVPLTPQRILNPATSGTPGNFTARFVSGAGNGARILAVSASVVRRPKSISFYNPPNLRSGTNGADYLILSAPEFLPALQTLANYRSGSGLRTRLLDIRDVYNEFGDGIAHPIAIKNFLAYTFQHWQPPAPAYALLVGDGHWNLKGFNPARYGNATVYLPPSLGWVDPWQGEVDATNLLAAIVGDDPLPDLHIARLPVNTPAEVEAVTAKILAYESGFPQDWQGRLLFVADDTPDEAGDFVLQAEALISGYLSHPWRADRVYLDSYKDTGTCGTGSPGTCPAANAAIRDALNGNGALLVTYFGHASISAWASERMWMVNDLTHLTNGGRLPVILSMTCWDGYWIGPSGGALSYGPGLVEAMLRAEGRGAVGAFSPGGLGVGTGHDALAEGFFAALFESGAWELGQAALSARLRLYSTGADADLLNTYTILGDPALRIATSFNGRMIYLPAVKK